MNTEFQNEHPDVLDEEIDAIGGYGVGAGFTEPSSQTISGETIDNPEEAQEAKENEGLSLMDRVMDAPPSTWFLVVMGVVVVVGLIRAKRMQSSS